MTKKLTRSLGALALAGAFAFTLAGLNVRAEVIEQVLVKVNGEIFTKTDLEARQVAVLRQSGQDIDLKSAAADAQLRARLQEITPEIMVNVVDEMLIVQRGRELGHTMSNEQFQSILDNLKKENNITSDEQLKQALAQENMTLDDLRRNLERQMIISRVRQNEILGRIAVAENEARDYYKAHMNEFTAPASVTLREIFVAAGTDQNPADAATDQAARAKAESIRARAQAGESFETLATELSDSPSKANGGLIGPFTMSEVSPDLVKLVEAMKPGQVTEVLRTARGYQLLQLVSLTEAQVKPFEEAREEIGNRVFTDKQRAEFEKYIARLRAEAIIEWKNVEVEKAYQAGLEKLKSAPAGAAAAPPSA
jgi:parvulin-like peptidyl-prolyl isomerase